MKEDKTSCPPSVNVTIRPVPPTKTKTNVDHPVLLAAYTNSCQGMRRMSLDDDEASLLSDDDSSKFASPLGDDKLKAFPITREKEKDEDNQKKLETPPTTLPPLLYSDNDDENDFLPDDSGLTRKLSIDDSCQRPPPAGSRITSITYMVPPPSSSLFVDLTACPGSSSSSASLCSASSSSSLSVKSPLPTAGQEEHTNEGGTSVLNMDPSKSRKTEEDNPTRSPEPQQAAIPQHNPLHQQQQPQQPPVRCVYPADTTTFSFDDDAASIGRSTEEANQIMYHRHPQEQELNESLDSPSRYPPTPCDEQQLCSPVNRLSTETSSSSATSGQATATSMSTTCSSSPSSYSMSPPNSTRRRLSPFSPDFPIDRHSQTLFTPPSARTSSPKEEEPIGRVNVTMARKKKGKSRPRSECSSDDEYLWNKRRRTRSSRVPRRVRDRPTRVQEVSKCVPLSFFDRQVLHEMSWESLLWNPQTVVSHNDLTKRSALKYVFNKETRTRYHKSSSQTVDDDEDDDELALVPGGCVYNVEYDSRHWQVDENDDGILVDQLQRIMAPQTRSNSMDSPVPPQQWTRLADPPPPALSASRRGPAFQARLPYLSKSTVWGHQRASTMRPSNSTDQKIWDPRQANEAIEQGEDIDGFLEGELELSTKTKRMEVLHTCNYSVQTARQYLANSELENQTTAFSETEVLDFEDVIVGSKKDFGAIAKRLGRSKADVLTHYYRWKGTGPRRYRVAKPRWKQWWAIGDAPTSTEAPGNHLYSPRRSYKDRYRSVDLISSPLSRQL